MTLTVPQEPLIYAPVAEWEAWLAYARKRAERCRSLPRWRLWMASIRVASDVLATKRSGKEPERG